EAGNERELAIKHAEYSKKVMIIGGGAAGLETARVAALRGHHVSLYEKENELGGQVNIASCAPGRVDFAEVSRYYAYQMKILDIDVHLKTQVTEAMVDNEKPEVVVVATGSTEVLPSLSGADTSTVLGITDVLQDKADIGQNVVIVAYEHHSRALCTADFLVDRGKKVEIIVDALYAGAQLDRSTLEAVYPRLLKKGVIITPLTRVKEIKSSTVVVYNTLSGVERCIEGIDTIVLATEPRADDSLYRSLKGKAKQRHAVGQCLAPRRLLDSIADGARVGRLI
ncbi:FAD-dependent oxidoreductase, partial [Chloroflexota bacterium]